MPRLTTVRRHPCWSAGIALALAGAAAFVLVYFAPQDLLIQTSVDEPLPVAGSSVVVPSSAPGAPASEPSAPPVVVLGRGRFRSGEHDTTGTASLLRLADGRRFVRLDRLSTSNGPAVRVWLSTARAGAADDAVAGADHLDLGGLKANHGNQNYAVPARADVTRFRSVVIWCRRFDVVFGSAAISG